MALDKTRAGQRVRLDHCSDIFTDLRPGVLGTIRWERFDGTFNMVQIAWDNGSYLALIDGEDRYTVVGAE